MATVCLGEKIPKFDAIATGGLQITSSALAGHPYVIYFYPKDSTPGCTMEGRDFRDHHPEFTRHHIAILGVSRDGLPSHEKFKAKHDFPFDLISDPDETLCRLFDVIREKTLFGKKIMGIQRSTFLVDAAGVLRQEWRKVKVSGHVENVLAAAVSL